MTTFTEITNGCKRYAVALHNQQFNLSACPLHITEGVQCVLSDIKTDSVTESPLSTLKNIAVSFGLGRTKFTKPSTLICTFAQAQGILVLERKTHRTLNEDKYRILRIETLKLESVFFANLKLDPLFDGQPVEFEHYPLPKHSIPWPMH